VPYLCIWAVCMHLVGACRVGSALSMYMGSLHASRLSSVSSLVYIDGIENALYNSRGD
jgi:hypothetical protein